MNKFAMIISSTGAQILPGPPTGGEDMGTYPQLDRAPLTIESPSREVRKVRRHLSQAMVLE